jgi:WD40 repeat protein
VEKTADLTGHNAGIFTLSFTRDGRYLASGDADKYVIIWDLETLTSVTRLKPHTRYVTHVSFSPDGSLFATCSNDKSIKVWRVSHGTPSPTAPQRRESLTTISTLSLHYRNLPNVLLVSVNFKKSPTMFSITCFRFPYRIVKPLKNDNWLKMILYAPRK